MTNHTVIGHVAELHGYHIGKEIRIEGHFDGEWRELFGIQHRPSYAILNIRTGEEVTNHFFHRDTSVEVRDPSP